MEMSNFKKYFLRIVIGSLIGAAGIAVVSVLAGEFNDTLGKALLTLGLVAVHALLSITYLDSREKTNITHNMSIFPNTVFSLIVLSFFTSIFGIWELFPGDLVGKLYLTYFIFLFASLHGELLADTLHKERKIDNLVFSNFVIMAVVLIMLLPIIWTPDIELGNFYYRLLAAIAIIDATLTILVAIYHKIYLQSHPQENSYLFQKETVYDEQGRPVVAAKQEQKRKMHPLMIILIFFLVVQIIVPLVLSLAF